MVDWEIAEKLMRSFPDSFINQRGEFIAHAAANEYFILKNCQGEIDVKCKVLEWLSRAAFKTAPFSRAIKNTALHIFMLNGINTFLGTAFSPEDMDQIYTYLGNACNHAKTMQFVESGYDMAVLLEGEE